MENWTFIISRLLVELIVVDLNNVHVIIGVYENIFIFQISRLLFYFHNFLGISIHALNVTYRNKKNILPQVQLSLL